MYVYTYRLIPKIIGKRPFCGPFGLGTLPAEEHDALHDPRLRTVVVL